MLESSTALLTSSQAHQVPSATFLAFLKGLATYKTLHRTAPIDFTMEKTLTLDNVFLTSKDILDVSIFKQ
jgi:hypothetical protein